MPLMTRSSDDPMIRSLAPFAPVSPELSAQLSTYLDLLLRWNARMNLTSVRDPETIVTRHFGESLFAARHLFPSQVGAEPALSLPKGALACSAGRSSAADHPITSSPRRRMLVDLGSGPGFPGVPIKLWAASVRVTLVESKYRKAIFLREVIRTLQLDDISVFAGRAEDLPPHPAPLTVTLRAVERFADILPLAASLLRSATSSDHAITRSPDSYRLALLIGDSQLPAARTLLPDFSWHDPLPIPNSSSRLLLIGTLS